MVAEYNSQENLKLLLPNDWEIKSLSSTVWINPRYSLEIGVSYNYVPMENVKVGFKGVTINSERTHGEFSGTKFKNGDVLFAKITPCTENGKVCLVEKLETNYGIGSTEFIVFSPITSKVDPQYLFFILTTHSIFSRAASLMEGSTGRQRVPRDIFEKFFVLFPPLQEQKKIAEILSTVDEQIEKTEAIIQETQRLKKGLMQQLFTKGIGHTKFKETKIGIIPEDWEVKPLIGVAKPEKYSFTGGPFGSDLKSEEYTKTGVRIIQLQNIGVGKFLNDYKIFTSDEKANQLSSCNIYPGDIIIAKMADPVARACLMPSTEERYLMASDGIRLSVDEEQFDTLFILNSINSKYFNKSAERHSTGTTRLRIGLTDLKKLLLKIPPLPEQEKIAEILTEVDNKIEIEQQTKSELEKLKKGLMQNLLTGKVRVNIS